MVKIPELPDVDEWTEQESLKRERDVVGMYLSSHPLLKYAEDLEEFSNFDFTDDIEQINVDQIRIGGMIRDFRPHYQRNNKEMAFFNLDCLGGQAEIVVFHDPYVKYKELIANDAIVFVAGKPADNSNFSDLKLIADEIVALNRVRDYFAKRINIRFNEMDVTADDIEELHMVAKKYQGKCNLVFHVANGKQRPQKIFAHNLKVSSHREFLKTLRQRYGKKNVWISS